MDRFSLYSVRIRLKDWLEKVSPLVIRISSKNSVKILLTA